MLPLKLEQFLQEMRMVEILRKDGAKHKALFRKKIECDYLNKAGLDFDIALEMIDEICRNKIISVQTQEKFDVIYRYIFDLSCIASVVSTEMNHSATILDDHIKQIKAGNDTCPCCGKELSDEEIYKLQIDYKDYKTYEWFYDKIYNLLRKNLTELKKLGVDKNFNLRNWQKGIKSVGARQRVDEISEVQ